METSDPNAVRPAVLSRDYGDVLPCDEASDTAETRAVWCDGEDWIIATSAEDAEAIYCDATGESREGCDPFERLPDEKALALDMDDGEGGVTRSAAEWAEREGRGFLASANW